MHLQLGIRCYWSKGDRQNEEGYTVSPTIILWRAQDRNQCRVTHSTGDNHSTLFNCQHISDTSCTIYRYRYHNSCPIRSTVDTPQNERSPCKHASKEELFAHAQCNPDRPIRLKLHRLLWRRLHSVASICLTSALQRLLLIEVPLFSSNSSTYSINLHNGERRKPAVQSESSRRLQYSV